MVATRNCSEPPTPRGEKKKAYERCIKTQRQYYTIAASTSPTTPASQRASTKPSPEQRETRHDLEPRSSPLQARKRCRSHDGSRGLIEFGSAPSGTSSHEHSRHPVPLKKPLPTRKVRRLVPVTKLRRGEGRQKPPRGDWGRARAQRISRKRTRRPGNTYADTKHRDAQPRLR